MAFFCKNAQEEALRELARQVWIRNEIDVLRDLRNAGAITDEQYIEKLQRIWKIAHN